MPGQGVIVGVGALDYPAAFQGADPATLADLGVSKVMTITSTYDHRIIQGAESGLFLKRVHELLLGADDFYDEIFRVARRALRGRCSGGATSTRSTASRRCSRSRCRCRPLINMHRVRGHLIADLDPLAWKEPHMHPELDPATYGLTIWDLDREFLTDGLGRHATRMTLGDILHVLRDAYCRTIGIEYMHIQEPDREALDPGAGRGRRRRRSTPTSSATSSTGSTRPRRSRSSSPPSTSARSASASRAPSRPSRSSTPCSSEAADARPRLGA